MKDTFIYKFPFNLRLVVFSLLFFLAGIGLILTSRNQKAQRNTTAYAQKAPRVIIVDHNSIALFEQIPQEYIDVARNTHMVFSDRSVGQNINEALDCLTASSWLSAPSRCRVDYYRKDGNTWYSKTFGSTEYNSGTVPSRILFTPDPVKYSRASWTFVPKSDSWENLTADFVRNIVPTYKDANDVISYQFSYLNITPDSNISDPVSGFFADQPHYGYYVNRERWDISDLEDIERNYPNKKFIYWTTSLARSIGTQQGDDFNNQMRSYARTHNKILFDFADIESHDANSNPCYDIRDGVQTCNGNTGVCEDYADDGQNLTAICRDYTTEKDGGHLGSVAGGEIRVAKAFWVLMAEIAGWDPGNSSPSPTNSVPTPTTIFTPSPTSVPTLTPTPSPIPTAAPTNIPTSAGGAGGLISSWGFASDNVTDDINGCTGCSNYQATWFTPSVLSGGFSFNGATSYLNLGSFPYLNNRSAFTVSMWIRPSFDQTSSTWRHVLSDGNNFTIFYLGSNHYWRTMVRSTVSTYTLDSQNLTWNPGTWHLLTITYNSNQFNFYWDGSLIRSRTVSGPVAADTGGTYLGRSIVASNYFYGGIDELRIFDYALSASEVLSLYQNY